jgi:hypothetical protein
MKLSEQPSRIYGLMAGEVTLKLLGPETGLRVKFALLTDEGPVGYADVGIGGQWSEKTLKAMQAFTESLEEDALRLIFKPSTQASETPQSEGPGDPPQF